MFFLVEGPKHNAELVWIDNGANYFACKMRCPQHHQREAVSSAARSSVASSGNNHNHNSGGSSSSSSSSSSGGGSGSGSGSGNGRFFGVPSIVHFVGVPKPSELFPAAQRRSAILNGFSPAFPEFRFTRLLYVTWYGVRMCL